MIYFRWWQKLFIFHCRRWKIALKTTFHKPWSNQYEPIHQRGIPPIKTLTRKYDTLSVLSKLFHRHFRKWLIYFIIISSGNYWKYDHAAQSVPYTILLSFHDINGAYPLVTLKTFEGFHGNIRLRSWLACVCIRLLCIAHSRIEDNLLSVHLL